MQVHRRILAAAAAALLAGFLASSSCHASFCSGECCDRQDPPCGSGGSGGSQPSSLEAFRLRAFRLSFAQEAGWHPIADIEDIEGPPPLLVDCECPKAREALARHASLVIAANPELLGLPGDAGRLAPLDAELTPEGARVRFAQVLDLDGGGLAAVLDAGASFHFDAFGALRRIENRTRLLPVAPWVTP